MPKYEDLRSMDGTLRELASRANAAAIKKIQSRIPGVELLQTSFEIDTVLTPDTTQATVKLTFKVKIDKDRAIPGYSHEMIALSLNKILKETEDEKSFMSFKTDPSLGRDGEGYAHFVLCVKVDI